MNFTVCIFEFQMMEVQEDDATQCNVDRNANRKQCSCQLLEAEIIKLGKLARQALATLQSNEYVCPKCGEYTQRTDQ